jgi:monovalent cation:H+ antiporter, CPA1 family
MGSGSSVEFLIALLLVACAIAVFARSVRLPYTAVLVVGGILLSLLHLPREYAGAGAQQPHWLTSDFILMVVIPGLVFEGSLKLKLRELLHDSSPLLLLATAGVLVAASVTGALVHWTVGLPMLAAFLFGSIIAATDPISVLAIFRALRMDKRLSMLLEAESLLNDGTAAALFQVVLAGVLAGHLSVATGAGLFVYSVIGGALIGAVAGYAASRITVRIDDAEIEITLTTIVAYGSYLLAYHLHLSGIIATAAAGLMVGNVGAPQGMSVRTRTALVSFWEYLAFVMNSLIFLLIGLEVQVNTLTREWRPLLFGVMAALVGRAVSVYGLVPISNLIGEKISPRWQHVMVWGGLRGGLALALALSLDHSVPERARILNLTFGVVVFSILVQGCTMKPLLKIIGLAKEKSEAEIEQAAYVES